MKKFIVLGIPALVLGGVAAMYFGPTKFTPYWLRIPILETCNTLQAVTKENKSANVIDPVAQKPFINIGSQFRDGVNALCVPWLDQAS